MNLEERPREKALRYGVDALSNRELIALLLRGGVMNHSVLEVADDVSAFKEKSGRTSKRQLF